MKQGILGLSNEEVDAKLSAIVRLFCCLHGRDVYIKAYQSYLSQRLLNKTMISQEAEELMLSKLKMELGINAVNKMTQMFKDMQLSREMHANFVNNGNNKVKGIEL
jgi:tRNA(Glu) U13 pseudouridine synthase TruD